MLEVVDWSYIAYYHHISLQAWLKVKLKTRLSMSMLAEYREVCYTAYKECWMYTNDILKISITNNFLRQKPPSQLNKLKNQQK